MSSTAITRPADTRTWGWPWILAVPLAGLVVESVIMARAAAPDADGVTVAASVGFWVWAAAPFVITGFLQGLAVRRNRVAWWLALGLAVLVTGYGVLFSVQFLQSASSTAALAWIFGPLVQLGAALAVAIPVMIFSLHPTMRLQRQLG